MTDEQLLRVWLELECIGIENDRLIRIGGSVCDDVEQVLDARFSSGEHKMYFRSDVDPGAIPPSNEVRQEITYYYQSIKPFLPDPWLVYRGDNADYLDEYAISYDGITQSRAWSVRRNERAAEIAVETYEGWRRKGYGRQVVLAWVEYQLHHGKIPIYSHRKGNLESEALAKSTGAIRFVEVVSYH